MKFLYFAYGSNMDLEDFKKYCSDKGHTDVTSEMKSVAVGKLENYDLLFNYYSVGRKGGAANIAPCAGKDVYGLIYEVSQNALDVIRIKEGCPKYYGEVELEVEMLGTSRKEKVLSYIVVKEREKKEHQPPTEEYLRLILENAIKNNFPEFYVKKLQAISIIKRP